MKDQNLVNEWRQQRAKIIAKMRELTDTINKEKRDFTLSESESWNCYEGEVRRLEGAIAREEVQIEREFSLAAKADQQGGATVFGDHRKQGENYETATESDLVGRDHSVEKHLRNRGHIHQNQFEKLSLGGVMRSLVTGPRTKEERASLAEGADATGGVSVPDVVLARFIDKMRAASVCIRAGAKTLPLTSDKTTIARTLTDPVAAWRSEAGPVAESDPTFEGLVFVPRSLAVLFKASREVLEDSLNIEEALETSLRNALALELDRVALEGTGTPPQPKGISPTTNVGSVSVGAAITNWDKFIDGLYELWVDNSADPTAIVMHPRTLATIAKFKEGTTNAPLSAPPVLASVPIYPTTSIAINLSPGTATTVYMGDFTQLIFGIRTELRIEILRELFAENMQYAFLAHLRADIGLQHPESFVKLTGIVP